MKSIQMSELPKCDFCEKKAKYDAPTKQGPWAYMCEEHFKIHASPSASEVGTKLVKLEKKKVPKPEKIKTVSVPLTMEAVATVRCPYCGTPRSVEPDANYIVTCEGCGHEYRVASMI